MHRQSVEKLTYLLKARGLRLASAESCTGGLVAAAMTAQPGSSTVFECGFVTYSNRSKTALLGVPEEVLETYGAISEQTARAMASGALARSGADIALSITGIAGPGGATPAKPVGLVHIGCALRGGKVESSAHNFTGDRDAVRDSAVRTALERAIAALENFPE